MDFEIHWSLSFTPILSFRDSQTWSSIPHPFLDTPQWLLHVFGVKILKLPQAHLWVEMDSKVHRLQKPHTPRNQVEKMRIYLLWIHIHRELSILQMCLRVVLCPSSPVLTADASLGILAPWLVDGFGQCKALAGDWRGRKIGSGHFFPISYFLHQPGISLPQQLPVWLPFFCIWRPAGVTVSSSNVTRLQVLDHPTRIPPPAPPFEFDALNPHHICLLPKGTLTDSGFNN